MYTSIGLYSYAAACLSYTLLGVAMLLVWRNRALSLAAITAGGITATWAAVMAASTVFPAIPGALRDGIELARDVLWIFLLVSIYANRLRGTDHVLGGNRWLPVFLTGLVLVMILLGGAPLVGRVLDIHPVLVKAFIHCIWISLNLIGLLVLENIYRNSSDEERRWAKYLVLGLGFMFAYDFMMHTSALMLQALDPVIWVARGFAVALTAPLVGLAAARSRDRRARTGLSRHVVFHSLTLLVGGVYLMVMAVVGTLVNYFGGSWGGVLELTFLSASALLLITLMVSSRVRAKSRVWLAKNFFSYKYDYRLEWLEFTDTLAEGGDHTPSAIIQAMAKLAHCDSGVLWAMDEGKAYHLVDSWNVTAMEEAGDFSGLHEWLRNTSWVIELDEWREKPWLYSGLEMPEATGKAPGNWLIVPLMFGKHLEGVLTLGCGELYEGLNWEDRDLLKVAGRQAASHLAQYQASKTNLELRQFEAFNRLSAFVVHDLKNILAEQSLIVSNADRHRDNPEFFDDVIETVNDSVGRMTRLMAQMESGERGGDADRIELAELLRESVGASNGDPPVPELYLKVEELWVEADREQLGTVFRHLIQNAREATDKYGWVYVRLQQEDDHAVVEVEDNGAGMSEDFIRERLFRPFDSTKGLTGMGVGAFESREVVRSLGGVLQVRSQPGLGTCFRIVLPSVEPDKKTKPAAQVVAGG